jgi:hypothetical protein
MLDYAKPCPPSGIGSTEDSEGTEGIEGTEDKRGTDTKMLMVLKVQEVIRLL